MNVVSLLKLAFVSQSLTKIVLPGIVLETTDNKIKKYFFSSVAFSGRNKRQANELETIGGGL